jgi:ElaB/YqjD/DUF883 family membrane-anchored ribosome-binding protein
MAEERTLGIARARETWDEEQPSKEQLQRRMDEARDSITNTVSEIKDNVAQQVETVKDALDWREHFKKQPLAWSLGAAGVGFLMGYGLAAVIRGEDESPEYLSETPGTYARSLTRESLRAPIEKKKKKKKNKTQKKKKPKKKNHPSIEKKKPHKNQNRKGRKRHRA